MLRLGVWGIARWVGVEDEEWEWEWADNGFIGLCYPG